MKPIAVIGAGGYVGARLIERSELLGRPQLVSIVRTWLSQGRLARYGVRTVRGDAGDRASLVPLLEGCGMVVNLTLGDDKRIVGDVQAMYTACREAGVPLFVHMSSAEVFGRAEDPALREESAPDGQHWMEYGREKAAAEAWLRSQWDGSVKVVILRPGLIWGPGSGWLVEPAKALVDGTALLYSEGRGVCNLIHVDNVIEHLMVLAQSEPQSGVFNIADPETLSWAEYYHAIAREVGADESAIRLAPDSDFRESPWKRLMQLPPAMAVKSRMSGQAKVRVKQRLKDLVASRHPESRPFVPQPSVSKQFWWVQGTARKLPSSAFAERYPTVRLQSFPDLMAAAGRWLRWAGFECVNGYSPGE